MLWRRHWFLGCELFLTSVWWDGRFWVSMLASLGGGGSVVTFFLRRGSFLMSVNGSVSIVAAGSVILSLGMVLFVLAAVFVVVVI